MAKKAPPKGKRWTAKGKPGPNAPKGGKKK
jgi:hypothetical protein